MSQTETSPKGQKGQNRNAPKGQNRTKKKGKMSPSPKSRPQNPLKRPKCTFPSKNRDYDKECKGIVT